MCPPMWAHWAHVGATWRIWLNLCFLRTTIVHNPSANRSVQPFCAQITAECCRVHLRHQANTIENVHNGTTLRIRLNLCFFRPTRVHTPNRLVQPFMRNSRHKVPILYNGRPFPQKCPFPRGSGPHLIHDSLGQCDT